MKYMYRDKLYEGTRAEIVELLIIDLRDLLGFDPQFIARALSDVPDTYDIEIGPDKFSGTKAEILDQYKKVQDIAPIVADGIGGTYVTILGIGVYLDRGTQVEEARQLILEKVKQRINDL